MSIAEGRTTYLNEFAEFLARRPTVEEVLAYHPSAAVHARGHELLEKLRANELSDEERDELNQFRQAETLVRLVKARILLQKAPTK